MTQRSDGADAPATVSTSEGVKQTPDRLRFDERKLDAYLAAHLPGFAGPLSVKQFSGGQSNPTYLLETPGARYVLRRKPPGDLLPSAHAVEREHRIMTALHGAGFPAPRTYLLCEDADVIGSVFFVMEFIEGRIFWEARLPDTEPAERRAIYDAMIDTQAKLHSIDFQSVGLADYGKHTDYIARQIGRWSKQYQAAETGEIRAMNDLIEWLPGAAPKDDSVSIVHGDFRLDNVIFASDRAEPLAVLDWELSTLGHPLADFTYFLMVWEFPPDVRGGLLGADFEALGIPTIEEAAARYGARTGRGEIDNLDFYFAFNLFRMASILQGVYARSLQGNASSDQADAMGAQVKPLAEMAWRRAKQAGA
ncbi:MAG: phosphotransferase family protein [Pseudomonadota bacterium]